jgi:hypothetical protein
MARRDAVEYVAWYTRHLALLTLRRQTSNEYEVIDQDQDQEELFRLPEHANNLPVETIPAPRDRSGRANRPSSGPARWRIPRATLHRTCSFRSGG